LLHDADRSNDGDACGVFKFVAANFGDAISCYAGDGSGPNCCDHRNRSERSVFQRSLLAPDWRRLSQQWDDDLYYLQSAGTESWRRSGSNAEGHVVGRSDEERFAGNHCEPLPSNSISVDRQWIGGRGVQPNDWVIGGTPPYQWSVYNGPIVTGYEVGGGVPDGLTLSPTTGTISGTPTGAGTWYFEGTVTDATGASAVNGFLSVEITPTGPAGNPVPFVNQPLVPTAVPPGNPDFTLKVNGTGFVSGAVVNFNRAPLATTFVNTEHLTATVPAAAVANAATATVTVANPGSGRCAVQRGLFPGGRARSDSEFRGSSEFAVGTC
jgi:hypothetical protein